VARVPRKDQRQVQSYPGRRVRRVRVVHLRRKCIRIWKCVNRFRIVSFFWIRLLHVFSFFISVTGQLFLQRFRTSVPFWRRTKVNEYNVCFVFKNVSIVVVDDIILRYWELWTRLFRINDLGDILFIFSFLFFYVSVGVARRRSFTNIIYYCHRLQCICFIYICMFGRKKISV